MPIPFVGSLMQPNPSIESSSPVFSIFRYSIISTPVFPLNRKSPSLARQALPHDIKRDIDQSVPIEVPARVDDRPDGGVDRGRSDGEGCLRLLSGPGHMN